MSGGALVLLSVLAGVSVAYVVRWFQLERARGGGLATRAPGALDLATGFVTNFFDALGVGCFAPTTAVFKLRRRVADDQIPGTLNAGHAIPTVVEALIYISVVSVDLATLAGMIAAAVLGAWLGAGVVARLPRRSIQAGMGVALAIAALLFLAKALNVDPGGGLAVGLSGARLAFAVATSFVLGALMMVGVGLYAPCLILVSLLDMNPIVAFPIMAGSCAFLMPVGGVRFVASGRYDASAALGLTLGGVPGVLLAAFVVKTLSLNWLRWLVIAVALYTAALMLRSALRERT